MKVVSVVHFPEFGGPHNQSIRLAEPLTMHGIRSITALPPGPGSQRLLEAGIEVRELPLGRLRAVRDPRTQLRMFARLPWDIRDLRSLFEREQVSVVQLNGLINPHAAIAARSMGIPVVWQLLDTRPPMRVRKAMAPLVNHLADVVMPIGGRVLEAHPGIALGSQRTVTFYPPVDTSEFRQDRQSTLRHELGVPSHVPVVGCVANMNPQKGYEYFVEAAAKVKRIHSDTVFVTVGRIYSDHPTHGPYFQEVQKRATSLGLVPGRDIFFLGARADIPNALASFDVFALSSVPNSEGTPTVILEAMACGKPVVATDVGAVREVVTSNETGFVVPSLDPESMAQRIGQLLENHERACQMGMAGRKRVEQEFSLDRCVAAHVDAYERAIAHRRASRFSRV